MLSSFNQLYFFRFGNYIVPYQSFCCNSSKDGVWLKFGDEMKEKIILEEDVICLIYSILLFWTKTKVHFQAEMFDSRSLAPATLAPMTIASCDISRAATHSTELIPLCFSHAIMRIYFEAIWVYSLLRAYLSYTILKEKNDKMFSTSHVLVIFRDREVGSARRHYEQRVHYYKFWKMHRIKIQGSCDESFRNFSMW